MSPANKFVRHGVGAENRTHQKLLDLAERFRNATDAKEAERLGERLGCMIFGR